MTIWDWMFVFYLGASIALGAGLWLWKTRPSKNERLSFDKPCQCLHPIKCDLFDKCMRGDK
jgi:hypothetical protein